MRALVSGATGFLGSHLVRHLLAAGDEVTLLVRPESDARRLRDVSDRVTVVAGPASTWPSLVDRRAAPPCDAAFHLAWSGIHTPEARGDADRIRPNVELTHDFLDAAAAAGCRSVVGLGSQAEFGMRAGVIDERTPCTPSTAYGVAKVVAGTLLTTAAPLRGMRGAWLRLLSAYGPDDHASYLIPYLIDELLAGRSPSLSAGDQPHDTLYCDDVAAALRCAAVSERCSGFYVLAAGSGQTVREIAETVRRLVRTDATVRYGAPAGHPGWTGSSELLSGDTGWRPVVPLHLGLERTISWCRERDVVPASC